MKTCKENEIYRVVSEEDVLFPGLDSCIALVCLLEDGDRWVTHCVQDSGSRELMETIRTNVLRKKVVSVLVLGNLDQWGPELESQSEIVKKYKLEAPNDYALLGKMEPYLALTSAKQQKVRLYVAGFFGCDSSKVLLATCSGDVRQGGMSLTSSNNDVVKLGW